MLTGQLSLLKRVSHNCEKNLPDYNFRSTLRLGHHDDQLDEEAIENYYRNRYNEDTAAIARFVRLSHLFCLDPEFYQLDPDLHPFQLKKLLNFFCKKGLLLEQEKMQWDF